MVGVKSDGRARGSVRQAQLCGFTAAFALLFQSAALADDACARLQTFERGSFTQYPGEPAGRRWVELHWVGAWLDFEKGWGLECRHSPDKLSADVCEWLLHNTSFEFAEILPKQILRCHGYGFPPGDRSWADWKSDIDMLSDRRRLTLEIDYLTLRPSETGAIRLSASELDRGAALVELPALRPLRTEKAVEKP